MKKRHQIIYVIFETIISVVFSIFVGMLISATLKNIKATKMVKDFISQGVFEQNYGSDTEIYVVYTDEQIDDTIKFTIDDLYLGNTGDLYVMPISRVGSNELISGYMSYQFGGHAGVIGYFDNKEVLIEAMGGTAGEAYVFRHYDNIDVDLYKPEERSVIGLRIKNASIEEREQAYRYASTLIGKDYNYWYIFFNEDRYYCSDLCTRVYGEESGLNYNIDKDGGYVSIQDMMVFGDTYISFFKYIDPNTGKIRIYYLKSRS